MITPELLVDQNGHALIVVKEGRTFLHAVALFNPPVRVMKLPRQARRHLKPLEYKARPYPIARAVRRFREAGRSLGITRFGRGGPARDRRRAEGTVMTAKLAGVGSNHPRRNLKPGNTRVPTPQEVRAAREAVGLTKGEAAAKVLAGGEDTWEKWESLAPSQARRMHPGLFKLFLITTGQPLPEWLKD